MRVVVGPLAGVLHMRLRAFLFFNFLGAAAWVSLIAGAGYLFGRHWSELVRVLDRVSLAILIAVAVVVLYVLWTRRTRSSQA